MPNSPRSLMDAWSCAMVEWLKRCHDDVCASDGHPRNARLVETAAVLFLVYCGGSGGDRDVAIGHSERTPRVRARGGNAHCRRRVEFYELRLDTRGPSKPVDTAT